MDFILYLIRVTILTYSSDKHDKTTHVVKMTSRFVYYATYIFKSDSLDENYREIASKLGTLVNVLNNKLNLSSFFATNEDSEKENSQTSCRNVFMASFAVKSLGSSAPSDNSHRVTSVLKPLCAASTL